MADMWSAIQTLLEAGLIPLVNYESNPSVVQDYVINTQPAAGTVVPLNTRVVVNVSSFNQVVAGTATVPTVTGLYWKAATDALQAAFLSNDKYIWQANAAAAGVVIGQSLVAGTNVAAGTKVQLTLSAGPTRVPTTVSVPSVI